MDDSMLGDWEQVVVRDCSHIVGTSWVGTEHLKSGTLVEIERERLKGGGGGGSFHVGISNSSMTIQPVPSHVGDIRWLTMQHTGLSIQHQHVTTNYFFFDSPPLPPPSHALETPWRGALTI